MPMLRLLIAALTLFAAAHAQTGEAVRTGHAESRLIAEESAAVPGETLWVALAQELEEGWHVYWKNPGDSGLPVELSWELPEGFEAGDILYPLPHRLPLGPLTNFGHEGSPTFLVPIEVPASAKPGTMVRFGVLAEWLICLDVCIPEKAELSLTIPVSQTADPLPGQAARIRSARSAQPRDLGLAASYAEQDGSLVLRIDGVPNGEAFFYPVEGGLIEPSATQRTLREDGALYIEAEPGIEYAMAPPERIEGVLTLSEGGEEAGVAVTALRQDEPVATAPLLTQLRAAGTGSAPAGVGANTVGLPLLLLFALLGGLVLNAMPCVFPIVFLKATGIAQLAGVERGAVRRDAFAYTFGVLLTFAAMAALLLVLRSAGAQIGWGFQLQSPLAVSILALAIFLVGLNLAGLFEVGTSLQGRGSSLASRKGASGSFFTGLLAVVVAAPCIGPFLGAPVGYALAAPPVAALSVFLALGLGLALPYLLLGFVPKLVTVLPRPGPWMMRLKQLFAFAMFGTVVWLVWVVTLQAGPDGVLRLGIAFVFAGIAAWLFGIAQEKGSSPVLEATALGLLAAAVVTVTGLQTATTPAISTASTKVPYDETKLEAYRAEGQPVFIDFTAAWCVTCQYNKRVVLDTQEVQKLFAETGTVFMVGDLTSPDPVITAAIERQGRSGVPLYLYYDDEGGEPEVLPQILTARIMRQTLENRG